MSITPILLKKRRVGLSPGTVSLAAANSTIADEVYYNSFPKPDLFSDGRIVTLYKRAFSHAANGNIIFCIKHNISAPWQKAAIPGAVGNNPTLVVSGSRVIVGWSANTTSATFAYTDNLGMDWVDAGTITYPAGYTGAMNGKPVILPSGKIRQGLYLNPVDNTVNPYISRWIDSSDNGVSWALGSTMASQMKKNGGETSNDAIAAGRGIISECCPVITHLGATDNTTKLALFLRNEEYTGFMHYKSSDGGNTWTRTGNTVIFGGTLAYNRPVHTIKYNGLMYVFCGNRATGDYGVEYITATPDDLFNNVTANYSSAVRVYNALSDTLASDVDFGYSEPFIDAGGQLCCQFYDANPAYLISGNDWEDVKQIVVISV